MDLEVSDLGLVDFDTAYRRQMEVFSSVKAGRMSAGIIFCRHRPVITMGRHSADKNILASRAALAANNIKVLHINRGGDVTYHGPGQLTVYPVCNLALFKKDIHWFLRILERIIIGCLAEVGVASRRRDGLTGVWVEEKKIASIGIAVKNWITFHGFSLNVEDADNQGFSFIRPCGMDIATTSVETASGKKIGFDCLVSSLERRFRLCLM